MSDGRALVVGIDPSSIKLAFYALHPILPTVLPIRIVLGKKYAPEIAAKAFDATLEALEEISIMGGGLARKFAFLESPVVGRGGPRSTMVQAFTSGVVQACLVKTGYTIYLTHPSQWKNWLTGKANSNKDAIQRAMNGRFPKDARVAGSDGDVLDAAALARYGCEAIRRGALVASVRGM